MHVVVFVELVHERQQFLFRNRRQQQVVQGFGAYLPAGFLLVAHVNVRRGIIADQNHRQTRRPSPAPFETLDFFLDLFLNFLGDGFAVYDRRHALLRAETEKKSTSDKIPL
mgnify:CR=1 FL=1